MKDTNAFEVNGGHIFETDICIVGGGAAGIAIAKEFIGTSFNILLLESGDYSFNAETQSLYEFENVGHPLRAQGLNEGFTSRNRYLGGSTNTWAGRCAPLSGLDFEVREWVPNSGWPIKKFNLDLYYKQAADLLNLPNFDYFSSRKWEKYVLQNQPDFLDGETLAPVNFLFSSCPVNMKLAYIKQLQNAPNIRVFLNANVLEIEPNKDLKTVKRLHVSSLNNNVFFIKAKIYILACGGWENTRLLFLSRRHCVNGLGNQNDVLGRYYMEHPKVKSGVIVPSSNVLKSPIFLNRKKIRNGSTIVGIKLSDRVQIKEHLLNHYVELSPMFPNGMYEGIESLRSLPQNLSSPEKIINNLTRSTPHLVQIIKFVTRKYFNRPLPFEQITLTNHFEQVPNRESRIMLSEQRDALGLNRLKVDLRISPEEKSSIVRFHSILGEILASKRIGTLISDFQDIESPWHNITDSSHHLGTTRMSNNPKHGVVDENCRVHGLNNLYIASSSVFPTGGHVNPTLTIIALTLRLTDYLKNTVLPTM